MPPKGYKLSEEQREKFKKAHNTEQCRLKVSLAQKGRKHTENEGFKKGHKPINGTEKTRFKKGFKPWNTGKSGVYKKEVLENWSKKRKGENAYNWINADRTYPQDWTDDLKDSVRKRDDYTCQECGLHQDELSGRFKKHDVHHIDYNKFNCNPDNLITLCKSCHVKTNHNRDCWINYFK